MPLLAVILAAQNPQEAEVPITVERYVALNRLEAVKVAPGGDAVAFVLIEADVEANRYRTTLHVWEADRGAIAVVTDYADVRSPRWSAEGEFLSFLSTGPGSEPDAGAQVWLLGFGPGDEPKQLGSFPSGVVDYGWATDGSVYALTTDGSSGEREFWRIQVPDGTAEHVWSGDAGIREMAVSPDGRSIAFSTNGTGAIEDYLNYNLRILDLESRRSRELTSRPGSEVSPIWSPDSRIVAFRARQNPRYPYSQVELLTVPASGGAPSLLTESFDRTVVDHVWPADGDLLFTAELGTYTQIFVARENGAIESLTSGAYHFGPFDSSQGDDAIYSVRQSAAEMAELWRIEDSGDERLTQLNAHTERWKLGRQEVVEWIAPDGLSIEGVIVYPADFEEGRRYPLLVDLAGGPLSRAIDVIDRPSLHQLFAAHGYAVLAPNFRGSSGYGEGFATANRVDLAGGDLIDILSGIDRLIELGVADPQRLAVLGGASTPYGAFMTSWAITQTTRFDAAIASYGSVAAPGRQADLPEAVLFEAGYLETLERERSPLDAAPNVQTPLLILESGSNTLLSRSQRLYRTFTDLGHTVEYVELLSRATPNGFQDLFFRKLRWLDKYLKFGGADLFDFFLVEETVPGPGGWQLRVLSAEPRADYSGLRPDAGRYLEMTISLEPSEDALRNGTIQELRIDPADAISLLAPDGVTMPFAGTVTEFFGRETLIMGTPGPITIPIPEAGSPAALTVRMAFELPYEPGEYRFRITGFVPVRIWVPGDNVEGRPGIE